jgi:hypothetical protein
LVGKPDRNRSLGTTKRRWENNIGMDTEETGWEVMEWIHLLYLNYPYIFMAWCFVKYRVNLIVVILS